jgi:hypothetical protein
MADGGAVIPLTDLQRSAVAVLKVEADGRIKTISLPLDGQAPLGPNAWMWLSDSKLHVSWAKLGSRELRVARVPLDDFEAGFTTATVLPVDDPVIWIDGYWDLEGAQQRTPPDDPTPPPDLVLWTVLSPTNRLVVARVNAVTRMVQPSFFIPAVAPLHVTSSVVYGGNEVALLLRDDKGGLHYASSTTKILQPLSGVAGQTILPAQMPSLIASGKGSVQPWVYIRYIAPTGTVAYAKVHPAGIADDTHD